MHFQGEVPTRAELLVSSERILRLKVTDTPLAVEVAATVLSDISLYSGKVLDLRQVVVLIEKDNFVLANVPTAV